MNCRRVNTKGMAIAFLLFASAATMAAPLTISSTFDNLDGGALNPTSHVNFDKFEFITVTGGSVDLIASGDPVFGINCSGGSGKCIDLAGTTGVTSTVAIKGGIPFPEGQYKLSFELSGNQRPELFADPSARTDSLTISIGNQQPAFTFTRNTNDDFSLVELFFTVDAGNPVSSLTFFSFNNGVAPIIIGSSNNIGLILDNASLTAVPLPATAPLFLSALAALSGYYRRRIRVSVA